MWGIKLQRQSEMSLTRQIYQAFRNQMLEGQLKQGESLPSTRELAKILAVSRNTVCEAYEMLLAEGYIESQQGSPSRVANGLRLEKTSSPVGTFQKNLQSTCKYLADFRTGQPDLRKFPKQQWLKLLRKASEEMSLEQLGYTGPDGFYKLRVEIASWLFRTKGISVHPQDIFITAGSTQALHLLPDLICIDQRGIIVEDPCHLGMFRVFEKKGLNIYPIPVDKYGLKTDHLGELNACAVYVTPSHQFPLGGILPASRRAALIRYARDNDAYIIEDDYDSEFRYKGIPIAPLHTMDPQRVIYVGTFSKILFPALRIGYVILPEHLHSRWRHLRTHVDVQNSPFDQAALAEYLHTRKLDHHIQKMRRLYGQRRQILLEALDKTFGKTWNLWGDDAGLHIALEFPGIYFNHKFTQQCKENGIYISTVEYHCIKKGAHPDKLLLGYGHLEAEEILKGISLLYDYIKA